VRPRDESVSFALFVCNARTVSGVHVGACA
jgi:hypothetical protein